MLINLDNDKISSFLSFMGYNSFYPPQQLAIDNGLLDGTNTLVTTPTASGKTLISILAAIKALEKNKKVSVHDPIEIPCL